MPQPAPLQFRRAGRADLDAIIALLADDVLGSQREDVSIPAAPWRNATAQWWGACN